MNLGKRVHFSQLLLAFCLALMVVGAQVAPAFAGVQSFQSAAGVVRVIMFWMEGCGHCHYVIDEVLPPLQRQYGDRLEIRLVELSSGDHIAALYVLAESLGIPRNQTGVPFMVVGERALVGSGQIPEELPGLIDQHLAAGGLDWPSSPEINALLEIAESQASTRPESGGDAVVEAVLFTTSDCRSCQLMIAQAVEPALQTYGDQFQVQVVDIVTNEDVDYLRQLAASFGIPGDRVKLPMIIVGDIVLIDEDMVEGLPAVIEHYLEAGGAQVSVALPERVSPESAAPVGEGSAVTTGQPSGFNLAVLTTLILIASLLYGLVILMRRLQGLPATTRSKKLARQKVGWMERLPWLMPALLIAGMGVAGYLAYVETLEVPAVCGPVGDCNVVQTSPYAFLFGVLPVGVLGLIGYLLMLAAWWVQRSEDNPLASWSWLGLFGMAFFGVLFSIYLTYLEMFVIRAVCAWCLTSAVIMAALLALSAETGAKAIVSLFLRSNARLTA